MRKIFSLIVFLSFVFIFFNCEDKPADCNSPHLFSISTYIDENKSRDKDNFIEDFYKNITFKISPEKGNDFVIKNSGYEGNFTDLKLPLFLNDKKLKNRPEKIDSEVFNLIILSGDKEIFNKKVKIDYSTIPCFETVKEVYYLGEDNSWKVYKKERIPLLNGNNEPTGYEYSIDF